MARERSLSFGELEPPLEALRSGVRSLDARSIRDKLNELIAPALGQLSSAESESNVVRLETRSASGQ